MYTFTFSKTGRKGTVTIKIEITMGRKLNTRKEL